MTTLRACTSDAGRALRSQFSTLKHLALANIAETLKQIQGHHISASLR